MFSKGFTYTWKKFLVCLLSLIVVLLLQNSLLALDDSALDADQVENLIKFCPTKEEIELLKVFPSV